MRRRCFTAPNRSPPGETYGTKASAAFLACGGDDGGGSHKLRGRSFVQIRFDVNALADFSRFPVGEVRNGQDVRFSRFVCGRKLEAVVFALNSHDSKRFVTTDDYLLGDSFKN